MRLLFLPLAAALAGCSVTTQVRKEIRKSEADHRHHIGFYLWDDHKKKPVLGHKADRYFTPASNTKILTFYTALCLLGDSVPAFRYTLQNDTVFLWGMADPSFLNPSVHGNAAVYQWLRDVPGALVFSDAHFFASRLGPGWAWNDFAYDYSPEITPFPVYGNLIRAETNGIVKTIPSVPYRRVPGLKTISRDEHQNELLVWADTLRPGRGQVPFRYSPGFLARILSDTLNRPVGLVRRPLPLDAAAIKSIPLDSALRVLMQASDNMVAEHLLLAASAALSDSLQAQPAIAYMLKNELASLPDPPRWVDGSGLSRYNLLTPRSAVALWRLIDQRFTSQRILPLLAAGGKAGTLRNHYRGPVPYVYGKTGTLANNHCLSGYLFTRKGKRLFFSFMNSGFVAPTQVVRERMEKVLKLVHDKY
jgi:D-alanyl-D-alanine carboxypeptidase/D-alanyl-D-alanine-endopeptidase (penicillin-binding protein 4)